MRKLEEMKLCVECVYFFALFCENFHQTTSQERK